MNEDAVEQAALGWFEWIGYDTCRGADISPGAPEPERRSHQDVVLEARLLTALRRLNPKLPEETLEQVVRTVVHPPEPTLVQSNQWFHRLLIDGVPVEHAGPDGELRGDRARLIDADEPARNDLLVVQQLTVVSGPTVRRPDLVVYLNGLPIALLELKSPTAEHADLWSAFRQLQEYKESVASLLVYNELLVASDGLSTRVGSLTADESRFTPWRAIEPSDASSSSLEALIRDVFVPERLVDYLRSCVVFEEGERQGPPRKHIAGYHQFRAVRAARQSVKHAMRPEGDGRGGVIWHTQGSGKSLTMLMLSAALVNDIALRNPTIIVLTDRNDLDAQLYATFSAGRALLRQEPERATTREDLAAKLDRAAGGVIFTTIQKFQERGNAVSERTNVVVLADEAHRSQYGFTEGGARWMREALPNATFVGFTGTPLERDDRNTAAVFGVYADIYDIQQSIDDRATVPIYYEMRLVKLLGDEAGIAEAERSLEVALDADLVGGAPLLDIEIPLADLIAAPKRVRVVAREIVDHFEARRDAIEGKGMAVCVSRAACARLYDEIVALRPEWHDEDDGRGFVKVVVSGEPERDAGLLAGHLRTKAGRDVLARRFKDPADDLRLAIVCDMWLTGFDCPPLHTMYLDKPLAGHNLMQAIARVNRVFGDKPGGVVVDFLGIADALRDAVRTYTEAGGDGNPVTAIQREAVPLMERDFEALCDFFGALDYSGFERASGAQQLAIVAAGAEHVFEQTEGRRRFMELVGRLSKTYALCVPLDETRRVRGPLVFFQSVRAAIRKRLSDAEASEPRGDSRAAVRQVLADAVVSDGVIDLFGVAGLEDADIAVLSDEFLERLGSLPQKSLALEALRKLLTDQIRSRERVNIVQTRSFRDALDDALTRYTNRSISMAQVIDELIVLAHVIRAADARGADSGLNSDELAFYDALADNRPAREVLRDETLALIARELAVRIKARATLDWTEREAVRADMRRTVRRLLARHGYPPDAQSSATELVIRQVELLTERTLHPDTQ